MMDERFYRPMKVSFAETVHVALILKSYDPVQMPVSSRSKTCHRCLCFGCST
jgi:hypothetical protein